MTASPREQTGVLVMSYGTPSGPDDVESYYTHIRRGRAPTAEDLDDLIGRYRAIGGVSPLRERTLAQRDAITAALEALEPGRYVVARGDKHVSPFIEDGVAELAEAGVGRIVAVALAPHYSAGSVGEYLSRARTVGAERGLEVIGVDRWWDLSAFIAHQAASLRHALDRIEEPAKVLFTAHSLPERVLVDDPYPEELQASARAIADAAGLDPWSAWGIAWQSAGRTPEPWRGPDILHVIDELGATGRAAGVVVCAHGFVADHLEVRYDLDIEAAARAASAGLDFARTEPVGADPATMAQLAQRIASMARAPAGRAGGSRG